LYPEYNDLSFRSAKNTQFFLMCFVLTALTINKRELTKATKAALAVMSLDLRNKDARSNRCILKIAQVLVIHKAQQRRCFCRRNLPVGFFDHACADYRMSH
jgi:hypothetical protein